jgi:hypothetical protein
MLDFTINIKVALALDSDDMSGLLDGIDGNKRVKIYERNMYVGKNCMRSLCVEREEIKLI